MSEEKSGQGGARKGCHTCGNNEEKREMILKALETACRDKRFHEVKLDDVAQIAGVGKGTIYRYFRDKEDLFFQLMAYGFDGLCERVAAVAESAGAFPEKLRRACALISEFFRARHDLLRLIGEQELRMHTLDLGRQTIFEEHRQRLRQILRGVIELGIRDGVLRDDLAPDFMTRILMGLMRARNHGFSDLPEIPAIEEILTFFLQGAGRTGADRRSGAPAQGADVGA